ncbi:MAG: recombinase family protein [Parasporobacterium sp.]|nr:recombinase family protein [Parasporobacterium sp.]
MIACYMRLSVADGDLGDNNKDLSNSIENQISLIHNYIKSHSEFEDEFEDYIDDGYSGTNFNRPAFQKMLEHAKEGRIQTIIVKDLSRLGRNYVDVGDYLERIFPVLGVRFIAVASGYDSNQYQGTSMGLEVSLTNLINTLYSRDISKKTRSSLKMKWKKGQHTSSNAIYGYVINENTGNWEIDPEAADVVKLIFQKALEGWNTTMIAHHLNEKKVPTRQQYMKAKKIRNGYRKVPDEECLWTTTMVLCILRRYEYTGASVHGRSKVISVGSGLRRKADEKDKIIVENVHPALISSDEFYKAQEIVRQQQYRGGSQKVSFVLDGKICCGNCRYQMAISPYKGGTVYCYHRRNTGEYSSCDNTEYTWSQLTGIVQNAVFANVHLLGQLSYRIEEKSRPLTDNFSKKMKQVKDAIDSACADRIRQYEAYSEGIISKEDYIRRRDRINVKVDRYQQSYESMDQVLAYDSKVVGELDTQVKTAEYNDYQKTLTRDMVEAFVEEVYIYDSEHIEIKFTFQDALKEAKQYHEKLTEKSRLIKYAVAF